MEEVSKKADWPDGIVVVQKGRTASLAMKVPAIDMAAGVVAQESAIEEALRSAYQLMPYATDK